MAAPIAAAAVVEDPPQLMESRRGKPKLVFKGFFYKFGYKTKNGKTTWICDREKCPAKCISVGQDAALQVDGGEGHTHLPDPDRIQKEDFMSKLRAEACDQPMNTAQQCASHALVGLKPDEVQGLPTTENLKGTVWRARSADEKKHANQILRRCCPTMALWLLWPCHETSCRWMTSRSWSTTAGLRVVTRGFSSSAPRQLSSSWLPASCG